MHLFHLLLFSDFKKPPAVNHIVTWSATMVLKNSPSRSFKFKITKLLVSIGIIISIIIIITTIVIIIIKVKKQASSWSLIVKITLAHLHLLPNGSWNLVSLSSGQLFQKVENDENQFFAITSSKLVRNWFCFLIKFATKNQSKTISYSILELGSKTSFLMPKPVFICKFIPNDFLIHHPNYLY